RFSIKRVRREATVRTPQMIEMDLDATGGNAVRFRREYLAIDRPVPGFDTRNGGGGLKFRRSNVTIRPADVESWGEPQEQGLFKLVGQAVAIGIRVAAVGNVQNSEAKQNRAQSHHVFMLRHVILEEAIDKLRALGKEGACPEHQEPRRLRSP